MHPDLFHLLQLTDATLPIGGFAHSAGLETYVQKGIVHDARTATAFIRAMLQQNIQYTDAAFVSLAYDAAEEKNAKDLLLLDAECTAVKLPMELRQASQKTGMRFLKTFGPLCKCELADAYVEAIHTQHAAGHYCIAFGIYAQALAISKAQALAGFYYNAASAMVTNCVKLVPLGQQVGQSILFALHGLMQQLVQQSLQPKRELIGLCCAGFDIRSMQHEDLYSRLYMS